MPGVFVTVAPTPVRSPVAEITRSVGKSSNEVAGLRSVLFGTVPLTYEIGASDGIACAEALRTKMVSSPSSDILLVLLIRIVVLYTIILQCMSYSQQ